MDKLLFAKRLREQQKVKKMTQQQLADTLMVGICAVNQWGTPKGSLKEKGSLTSPENSAVPNIT